MPVPIINELLVGAVVKTILEYLTREGVQLALPPERLRSWLGRDPTQLALKVAVARAFATFADQHPDWAASFFDETFLTGPAAGLIARCLTPTGCPEAQELATAWAAQLDASNPGRPARVAQALPAAAGFLHAFSAELRNRDEFRPLYDSRALDVLSASAATTADRLQGIRDDLAAALQRANQKYQVSLAQGLGVLIGDNGQQINVYNLYGQAPRALADLIRTRQFETLVGERTQSFVGRDYIFSAIDDLLLDPEFPSGYVVIRGEPGIGKTALMAELVKRRGYVHHFNIAAQNIRSVADFLTNTCAQLIVRYGLPHTELQQEAVRDSGTLSSLLAEAAAKEPDPPIVVLVDALDEADDGSGAAAASGLNRLLMPRVLPPRVYFIVTTREKQEYRLVVDRREDIYIDDQSSQNKDDVRRYIGVFVDDHQPAMTTRIAEWGTDRESFVASLMDRSQGNFMYLVHVLRDILSAKLTRETMGDIRKLPEGLREYYRQHWRAMEVHDRERFTQQYKPVILILAAAQEPVTVDQLGEWTPLSPFDIREVIGYWREFLNKEPDALTGDDRWRIYHASFQDFLREDIGLKAPHTTISDAGMSLIRF